MAESELKTEQEADDRPMTKGERTLRSILRATHDVIEEEGLSAASQETVAKRAGITQGALRYHFRTKQALITAFFRAQYLRHREAMERVLLQPTTDPRQRILEMAAAHLEHILTASDTVTFEGFAYLARETEDRAMRDEWYGFLAGHYAALLKQINPDAETSACEFRAFQILTLCLGAWLTLGRTHPHLVDLPAETLKDRLIAEIDRLIDLEPGAA